MIPKNYDSKKKKEKEDRTYNTSKKGIDNNNGTLKKNSKN
jgi:hypothetical protein